MSATVAVIGGGFAGIAAACRLAGDGYRSVVFERSRRLGGRAASFRDPVTGEDVDYGHHISMRCCTATDGLLRRIGAGSSIRYQPELEVAMRCGPDRAVLRSNPLLPGVLHLLPALLADRCLSRGERLAVLRAGAALRFPVRSDRPFGPWLRRRGQSERAIARLWGPICTATLNASVDRVGLRAARKVFREGILDRDGAGLGLFVRPLGRIFDAAVDDLEARDGAIRVGTGVRAIRAERGRAVGVETEDGERVDADAIVAAVPPTDLARLVADGALDRTVREAGRLEWSPIVDVHLWFDGPIFEEDFIVAVDNPLQAVFDVTKLHGSGTSASGVDDPGIGPGRSGTRHLVISQSAAESWIDRGSDEVADALVEELRALLPSAREARVVRHLVVKHRRATFVPAPGADDVRPSAKTPIDRLYLAGDWTATGWPSTIEGAVRSGIAAAGRATVDLEGGGEGTEPDGVDG